MPDSASADSRSATRRARSSASCFSPSDQVVKARPHARELLCRGHPPQRGRRQSADEARQLLDVVRVHSNHPSTGRAPSLGIFHHGLQPFETPRNPACNRARRQVEVVRDRLVALVAGEEAVEDLLARLRQGGEHLADGQGLVELGQPVVEPGRLDLLASRPPGAAQPGRCTSAGSAGRSMAERARRRAAGRAARRPWRRRPGRRPRRPGGRTGSPGCRSRRRSARTARRAGSTPRRRRRGSGRRAPCRSGPSTRCTCDLMSVSRLKLKSRGRDQPRRAAARGAEPRHAARGAARADHAGRSSLPADPLRHPARRPGDLAADGRRRGRQRAVARLLANCARRPPLEVVATMECAGNGRATSSLARSASRGCSRRSAPAAGAARAWPRCSTRPASPSGAVEVLFTGLDRGIESGEEQWYQRSLPLDDALRDEVLLAYDLNGGPLPPQHGFPLRLLVPGLVRHDERQVALADHACSRSRSPATSRRRATACARTPTSRASRSRGSCRERCWCRPGSPTS